MVNALLYNRNRIDFINRVGHYNSIMGVLNLNLIIGIILYEKHSEQKWFISLGYIFPLGGVEKYGLCLITEIPQT